MHAPLPGSVLHGEVDEGRAEGVRRIRWVFARQVEGRGQREAPVEEGAFCPNPPLWDPTVTVLPPRSTLKKERKGQAGQYSRLV
mmetsp:Transcript_73017/g.122316  ORF Transcript_73017/g.122316 Transcript_73017/m.122316 type:complete len:84 (-) Transcript_73017:256-507(-)